MSEEIIKLFDIDKQSEMRGGNKTLELESSEVKSRATPANDTISERHLGKI